MHEDKIKAVIIETLNGDFILKSEQWGTHPLLHEKVRIDFLAYPRPHLVEAGFDAEWFGIEAKDIGEDVPKLNRVLCQSITYAQSRFSVGLTTIIPQFIMVCVGQDPDHLQGRLPTAWPILFSSVQYLNVGFLELSPWKLSFGAGRYYSQQRGKSAVKDIGRIRYVGTIS